VVSINSEGTIAVGGLAGAANLLTEAGQLLTSNGTEAVALDVGITGQVLTANSSAANGVEWANLPLMSQSTPVFEACEKSNSLHFYGSVTRVFSCILLHELS